MPGQDLRIAVFSDSALPVLNGVSVSVDTLVRELRNQGHSVHLFTVAAKGYRDEDPNTYRFRAWQSPWVKSYPVAVPPFYGMLRKFKRHRFDIIHTHTPFTIGFVGLRWAQSYEIPIVSTYHTLYDRYAHYVPFFPRRYVRFKTAKHTNFYYNSVDHVIVPSHAGMRWLRRHSVSTPITVIPTASPQPAMLDRSELRRELGIAPEQKVLLYVGRIAKEKNLEVLFRMVAEVFAKEPEARLWLVGDGPYRSRASTFARELGVGDRVRFVGFVPRAEVDRFYAVSDLFVFSSITETQGLVIQEAMTYGLPAVVVGGGGAGETVTEGETGFIVRNDAGAFADKVLEILRNDALHAKLSGAALRAFRRDGPKQMAESVLGVYRAVLEGSTVGAPDESRLARI